MDYALILAALTLLTGGFWLAHRLISRRQPQQQEDGLLAWLSTVGSVFPILLIVLLFRSFVFEPFKIPSGSMIPTLLIGDFIAVSKFSYGLRVPVINRKVLNTGQPQRGDVMVFRFPEDPRINYIKRVVGLPGDEVTYRNKVLFINGEPIAQDPMGPYIGEGLNRNPPGRQPEMRSETLGSSAHQIMVFPDRPERGSRTWSVPEGHYFVLGDNRDQSLDSRNWNFVPEDHLVGRAVRVWMHWDCSRGCVVWNRIGQRIE